MGFNCHWRVEDSLELGVTALLQFLPFLLPLKVISGWQRLGIEGLLETALENNGYLSYITCYKNPALLKLHFWSICSVFSLSCKTPTNSTKRNSCEFTQILANKFKVKSILKESLEAQHCGNDATHYLCYSVTALHSFPKLLSLFSWLETVDLYDSGSAELINP